MDALQTLERMGDDEDFETTPELQQKFERLALLIESYEKIHYPIEKGKPEEIEKLKKQYRKCGGYL